MINEALLHAAQTKEDRINTIRIRLEGRYLIKEDLKEKKPGLKLITYNGRLDFRDFIAPDVLETINLLIAQQLDKDLEVLKEELKKELGASE